MMVLTRNRTLTEPEDGMQLKSILNRVQRHQSFTYGTSRLLKQATRLVIEIEIKARKGSKPLCSECGSPGPGYDTLSVRRFEFVPLWGIVVFFLYAMRRVNCRTCGIKVEQVPWASGKNHLTTTYSWFLARWARRLSWKEVGEVFQTSWDNVFRSVKMAVAWGLEHRDLDNVTAIGIDEIAWRKRKDKFLTLVYQIDSGCRRLLWVGQSRTKKTLQNFFKEFGKERSALLRYVCTDMWKPYLDVVAEAAGQALNILDRFHIMVHMNKAIDKVRTTEVRELKAKGQKPVLTNSR
jgi:transposase